MLLQGNFVKVFVKIKVLKLPEVKCMCTYGVTLPGEHLQVAWWWQRWCLRIRCSASRGSLRPGSSTSACINHRLCFSISSIPVEEIIPVNPHLGTHAISVVNSSGSKIVIVTYECVEPSSNPAS